MNTYKIVHTAQGLSVLLANAKWVGTGSKMIVLASVRAQIAAGRNKTDAVAYQDYEGIRRYIRQALVDLRRQPYISLDDYRRVRNLLLRAHATAFELMADCNIPYTISEGGDA